MKFDLHVHTYYSDGLNSPATVVDNAMDRDLNGIAITDHDTILGIEEALSYCKKQRNFHLIPGLELSCIHDNSEVHILAYFIDYKNTEILTVTDELRRHRIIRVKKIIEKLRELNIKIDFDKIIEEYDNDFVGRVAVARELIKEGYTSSIQEAFQRYLNPGRAAYVERYKLSIDDAISLIKRADGIPVLAHPGLLSDKYLIQLCISKGIEGIECIHSKHTAKQVKNFKKIAENHDLIATGGSDCHGEIINGDLLLGKYTVDLNSIPEMKERLNDNL